VGVAVDEKFRAERDAGGVEAPREYVRPGDTRLVVLPGDDEIARRVRGDVCAIARGRPVHLELGALWHAGRVDSPGDDVPALGPDDDESARSRGDGRTTERGAAAVDLELGAGRHPARVE